MGPPAGAGGLLWELGPAVAGLAETGEGRRLLLCPLLCTLRLLFVRCRELDELTDDDEPEASGRLYGGCGKPCRQSAAESAGGWG